MLCAVFSRTLTLLSVFPGGGFNPNAKYQFMVSPGELSNEILLLSYDDLAPIAVCCCRIQWKYRGIRASENVSAPFHSM